MAQDKKTTKNPQKKSRMEHIVHTLDPVCDSECTVLINGSMLSPKSREFECYYGHPQNRFWKVLCSLWNDEDPILPRKRHAYALSHHVALWNVIRECDIIGAADSTIRNVVANDMKQILGNSKVCAIFNLGKEAGRLFEKFCISDLARSGFNPEIAPANFKKGDSAKSVDVSRFVSERDSSDVFVGTLPSTSPANAAWSLEDLKQKFGIVKQFADLKFES